MWCLYYFGEPEIRGLLLFLPLWNPRKRCGWMAQQWHLVERNYLDWKVWSPASLGLSAVIRGSRSACIFWWGKQRSRKAQWTDKIQGWGKEANGPVWVLTQWPTVQMGLWATSSHNPGTRPSTQLQRPVRVHQGHHLNPELLLITTFLPYDIMTVS